MYYSIQNQLNLFCYYLVAMHVVVLERRAECSAYPVLVVSKGHQSCADAFQVKRLFGDSRWPFWGPYQRHLIVEFAAAEAFDEFHHAFICHHFSVNHVRVPYKPFVFDRLSYHMLILFTFVIPAIEKGPQREFPAGGLYLCFLEFG